MGAVTGLDEVIVTERGGTNPVRLAVMQPVCSWALSDAGQFSAFVPLADLTAAGLPSDIKGRWLEWESPAGTWGGVITGRPISDGVCELAAMSWAVLLRSRVMEGAIRPASATPGGLARRVLMEATRDEPTFITIGQIDEGGTPITVSYDALDVFNDVLPLLTVDAGYEWEITPERVFNFARYIGEDRTATVRLVEGRHIASYRVSDDLWTIYNRLIGLSASAEMEGKFLLGSYQKVGDVKNPKYKKGKKGRRGRKWIKGLVPVYYVTYQNQIDPFVSMVTGAIDSIERYGPLELVREYPDTRDGGTIAARLQAELLQFANPAPACELSLLDVDDCYHRFKEGDVVWVDLGSAEIAGAFRVIHRAYDSSGLRVAGDLRPIAV